MSEKDGPACIVCRCTQNRACEEGCEWILRDPPVCSSCATPWLIAELWRALWLSQRRGWRNRRIEDQCINELHDLHHKIANRGHLPPMRLIRRIQRTLDRLETPAAKAPNKSK